MSKREDHDSHIASEESAESTALIAQNSEGNRPAFFLGALLTEDIPPYLTDETGAKKAFPHDPLARRLTKLLDDDPSAL